MAGGGGTINYNDLDNKPSINNTTLTGNISLKTINGENIVGSGNINIESNTNISSDFNNLPVINIIKTYDNSATPAQKILCLRCLNLNTTHSYKIYLLTKQRSHGMASKAWRHPYQTETNIANKIGYAAVRASETKHTSIPPWMPNQGILQTEWDIPLDSSATTATLNLDIYTWILDLVKPAHTNTIQEDITDWCLIGVTSSARNTAPRLFRFIIYDETTKTYGYPSEILKIGSVMVEPNSNNTAINNCTIDYISIQ